MQTSDLADDFFPELRRVADGLGAKPLDMVSVMYSESGCRADAWNDNPKNLPPEKRWNASGLIQFMPATLLGLGWRTGHAEFRKLSATAQLDFVRRYYAPYVPHLGSVGGLYVATFLPALVARSGDPSFVLTARGGPLGWAYDPNAAFDANRDLAITVGELEDAVRRNCQGKRWQEILQRLGQPDEGAPPLVETVDLRTTLGLQLALTQLGYQPGPADGLPGPRTRAALVAFQTHQKIAADGVFGPVTRANMQQALDASV